jgi:hypothetical protein
MTESRLFGSWHHRKISEVTEVPIGTVTSRLARAPHHEGGGWRDLSLGLKPQTKASS